jgi:hypothetical protein
MNWQEFIPSAMTLVQSLGVGRNAESQRNIKNKEEEKRRKEQLRHRRESKMNWYDQGSFHLTNSIFTVSPLAKAGSSKCSGISLGKVD